MNRMQNTKSSPRRRCQTSIKCASRACDQCRLRKTRCSLSRPCELCTVNGFECTFLTPRKKRGPPASRVKQIRQQQSQSTLPSRGANSNDLTNSHETNLSTIAPEDSSDFETSQALSDRTAYLVRAQMSPSLVQHQHPTSFDNLHEQELDPSLMFDNTLTDPPVWDSPSDLEHELSNHFNPSTSSFFVFSGSNISVKQTLPPIIDDVNFNLDDSLPMITGNTNQHVIQSEHPNSVPHGGVSALEPDVWPAYIHEANLIPWLDVFFDRLHPTLPVLDRSSLFIRLFQREHHSNHQFGAMILSLCAFSLTQPIDMIERPSSSSRADHARMMMTEAIKMRSSSDFGENPTIEAVLTSFFLFGFLFGSNQHNAARLRLRESVDLALIMGLNDPQTYVNCSTEYRGQLLRIYSVLSVTERAYALQRRLPISFIGPPLHPSRSMDDMRNATQRLVSGMIVHNEKDAAGMMGLSLLMEIFDAIDEDILACWNSRCSINNSNGRCQTLSESKVLNMYRNLAKISDPRRHNPRFDRLDVHTSQDSTYDENQHMMKELDGSRVLRNILSDTQCADVLVTQKWVQDRLWSLCYSHSCLRMYSEHEELCYRYAFDNAERTLELCRSLRLSAMEAHGFGMIEKLYDIATSALIDSCSMRNTSEMGISDRSVRDLARSYLTLLQTLRGGHHPYMEQYNNHLRSLGFLGPNGEWMM